jgi:phosphate transport system substrate-binding protein
MNTRFRRTQLTGLLGATALALAACGGGGDNTSDGAGDGVTGQVLIDGSSTVAPLLTLVAEDFQAENSGVRVTVGTSGTGGGFEKFCGGETDISNASREIKDSEKEACAAAGIEFVEVVVANDALSVVVNKNNDWAKCLTVAQLKTMWEPAAEGKVTNWNQIDPSFPDKKLGLFGAGTDSGTFDYFTDVVNGEEGASRTDYNPTEDDNVTVKGVEGDEGAIGYFGFSYLEENADRLKAVEIDGGKGCVAPSVAAVQDGTYVPLARPLYMYVSRAAAARPEMKAFLEFFEENRDELTLEALFVPLNDDQKAQEAAEIDSLFGS